MMHRLLRIRTARHPHELMVMVASIIIGVIGMVFPSNISGAIESSFNVWPARFFFLGMAVFGAVVILSSIKRGIEWLLIERAALVVLGTLFLAYSGTVVANSGTSGFIPIVLPACLALANFFRVWQIRTDLELLKSYLIDHPNFFDEPKSPQAGK